MFSGQTARIERGKKTRSPAWGGHVAVGIGNWMRVPITVVILIAASWSTAAQPLANPSLACPSGGSFTAGPAPGTRSGLLSAPGVSKNISCVFTIGEAGGFTVLHDVIADGDGLAFAVYDGPSADPVSLIVRLEERPWSRGSAATSELLSPLFQRGEGRELVSKSGFFTVTFQGVYFGWPAATEGLGLSANYSTARASAGPPAPRPLAPVAAAVTARRSVSVDTLESLMDAAVDQSVSNILLTAAIRLNGTTVALSGRARDLTISSDTASCRGRCLLDARGLSRAFLLSAGANLSLRDVELANCNATQGGCVLAVNGSSVSASRCFFRGAVADGDGGALLALAGSSLTLVNCSFVSCTSRAASGGAAAALFGSSVSASSCTFVDCTAFWGGALSAFEASLVNVSEGAFSGCSAWDGGAAAVRWGSSLSVAGATFTSCAARDNGGATVAAYFSSSVVSEATMTGCSASRGAGVASIFFSNATVDRGVFTNCPARYDGGCAFARLASNLTIAGLRCLGGTALASSEAGYGSGGGFSAYSSPNTTVVDSVFDNCSALTGGTFELVWSVVVIQNVTFRNSISLQEGGVGEAYGSATDWQSLPHCSAGAPGCDVNSLTITGSTFEGCRATGAGGALLVANVDFVLRDSAFRSCTSGGAGGALSLTSHSPLNGAARSRAVLEGLLFEGNTAERCGAVAILDEMASELTIRNVTATGNRALGGPGGALCYVRQAAAHTATWGQTAQLTDVNGDLSLVDVGAPVPIGAPFAASWAIRAFPGCTVALTLVDYTEFPGEGNLEQLFRITDARTGTLLLEFREQPAAPLWAGPYTRISSGSEGLLVSYSWAGLYPNSPTRTFATGFEASWTNLCSVQPSDGDDGGSGSGGGGPREAFSTNETTVLIEDFRASGNSAGRGAALSTGAVGFDDAGSGGAVFVAIRQSFARTLASTVTFRGARLERNRAEGPGGALLASGSVAFALEGSMLANNVTSGGHGGCVALDGAASARLDSVTFTRCSALGLSASGGAVAALSTALSASACAFEACTSSEDGGAVFASASPLVLLDRCSFTGNAAIGDQSRGGAVASLGTAGFTAVGCSFRRNRVAAAAQSSQTQVLLTGRDALVRSRAGDGGAAYLSSPAPGDSVGQAGRGAGGLSFARFASCTFNLNNVRQAGGGIAAWGEAMVSVEDSVFHNDSAFSGGAIAAGLGSQLSVANTSFSFCTADAGAAGARDFGDAGCADAASSSDGGAVWLGPGSASASLTSCILQHNVASSVGGAAAVSANSSLLLSNSSVLGNSASSGGAFAVSGSARLALLGVSATNNTARRFAGVVAYAAGAQQSAAVRLESVRLTGNRAAAGTLWAVVDTPVTFQEPSCVACEVAVSKAGSYGDRVASPPASMNVSVPRGNIRTGSSITVVASLQDAFGQIVMQAPALLASLSCLAQTDRGGVTLPSCDPSSLRGVVVTVYSDGGAAFSPLLVFGAPGTTFRLQISAGTSEIILSDPFNVTMAPCLDLEAFDPDSRLCSCVANAARANSSSTVAFVATLGGQTQPAGGCSCLPGFVEVSGGSLGGAAEAACVLKSAALVSSVDAMRAWWVPLVAVLIPCTVLVACVVSAVLVAQRSGCIPSGGADTGTMINPEELTVVITPEYKSFKRLIGHTVPEEEVVDGDGGEEPDFDKDALSAGQTDDGDAAEEVSVEDLIRVTSEVLLRGTRVTCRLLLRAAPARARAGGAAEVLAAVRSNISGSATMHFPTFHSQSGLGHTAAAGPFTAPHLSKQSSGGPADESAQILRVMSEPRVVALAAAAVRRISGSQTSRRSIDSQQPRTPRAPNVPSTSGCPSVERAAQPFAPHPAPYPHSLQHSPASGTAITAPFTRRGSSDGGEASQTASGAGSVRSARHRVSTAEPSRSLETIVSGLGMEPSASTKPRGVLLRGDIIAEGEPAGRFGGALSGRRRLGKSADRHSEASTGVSGTSDEDDGDDYEEDADGDGAEEGSAHGGSGAFVAGRVPRGKGKGDPTDWRRTNLKLLTDLHHPSIIATYGGCVIDGSAIVVQEFCAGGSLHDALFLQALPLDKALVVQIARDIALGARFLHGGAIPVVARLSSKRVHLTGSLAAKIFIPAAELPTSARDHQQHGQQGTRGHRESQSLSGVLHGVQSADVWTDPAVIAEGGDPSPASDVFAFGIILYELFARKRPYAQDLRRRRNHSNLTRKEALEDVLKSVARWDLRPSFPESVAPWVNNLSSDCWIRNPARRPAFGEICATLNSRAVELQRATAFDAAVAEEQSGSFDFAELQARTEEKRILEDVLPAHVVEALRGGRKVEPETFPEASLICLLSCVRRRS